MIERSVYNSNCSHSHLLLLWGKFITLAWSVFHHYRRWCVGHKLWQQYWSLFLPVCIFIDFLLLILFVFFSFLFWSWCWIFLFMVVLDNFFSVGVQTAKTISESVLDIFFLLLVFKLVGLFLDLSMDLYYYYYNNNNYYYYHCRCY